MEQGFVACLLDSLAAAIRHHKPPIASMSSHSPVIVVAVPFLSSIKCCKNQDFMQNDSFWPHNFPVVPLSWAMWFLLQFLHLS